MLALKKMAILCFAYVIYTWVKLGTLRYFCEWGYFSEKGPWCPFLRSYLHIRIYCGWRSLGCSSFAETGPKVVVDRSLQLFALSVFLTDGAVIFQEWSWDRIGPGIASRIRWICFFSVRPPILSVDWGLWLMRSERERDWKWNISAWSGQVCSCNSSHLAFPEQLCSLVP